MQYLHILEVAKKLNDRFSQFNSFADTAVLPCMIVYWGVFYFFFYTMLPLHDLNQDVYIILFKTTCLRLELCTNML